jgi:hypothetical protein
VHTFILEITLAAHAPPHTHTTHATCNTYLDYSARHQPTDVDQVVKGRVKQALALQGAVGESDVKEVSIVAGTDCLTLLVLVRQLKQLLCCLVRGV